MNCFVDNKEWKEGIVLHYHRSGKHNVHFYAVGEKKWMHMTKTLFYIIEHPDSETEIKEDDSSSEDLDDRVSLNILPLLTSSFHSLCRVKDKWIYLDHISLDYAFAQSVLFKIYGGSVQETGYRTKGHQSLSDVDK